MPSEPTLLLRDGLSQSQRHLSALNPSFARLDERTPDELLAFAAEYATVNGVRFHADSAPADGDYTTWAQLMTAPGGLSVAELEARADNPPHLALFLAFLRLFGLAQEQLNAFTQRHLDFYYREVLQLDPRGARPDQVHLTFELARNVASYVLPVDSGFDAGLDAGQQPQRYQAATQRLVNQIGLGSLRTVYVNAGKDKSGTLISNQQKLVYYASNAATADGVAEPLPAADPSWSAFGPSTTMAGAPRWPVAKIGFVLAAPVLRMAEGIRRVEVLLQLDSEEYAATLSEIKVTVQYSGPHGWIDVGSVVPTVDDKKQTLASLKVVISSRLPPVVDYNAAVLDGGYATTEPVLRLLLPDADSYPKLRDITLRSVEIKVSVDGIRRNLTLSNAQGSIDPTKAFYPFGTNPVKGSKLLVGCPETAHKALRMVRVCMPNWIGKPSTTDWPTYYRAYDGDTKVDDHRVQVSGTNWHIIVPPKDDVTLFRQISDYPYLCLEKYGGSDSQDVVQQFERTVLTGQDGVVTLELKKDLGHGQYPTLVNAYLANPKEVTNPNPPYTPLAEYIQLGYDATSGAVLLNDTEDPAPEHRYVRLFHHSVFGWAQELISLKDSLAFLAPDQRKNAFLLPQLALGGTFLLSLRDAQPLDTVAVLFQVAESSARLRDGQAPVEVRWSVLCRNQWYPLSEQLPPVDGTDHLQRSGIIEFTLPADITADNTLLEAGVVWLKGEPVLARLPDAAADAPRQPAPPDSVARLVGVHPQAVLTRFADQANDAAHYAAPLAAGSISKARPALAPLKTTRQPYAGFGGRPAETDLAFYTRVSERLRHKQRGVTRWDYEHLVLEQFPEIQKITCLNNTREGDDLASIERGETGGLLTPAPGHVTLLVFPRLQGPYTAAALTPGVAASTRRAIAGFLQPLVGPGVQLHMVNPRYKELQVKARVALRPGYPPATYLPRLQQELRIFLTPWTQEPPQEPTFGRGVQRSTIASFIDHLPYVDYVSDLELNPGQGEPDAEWVQANGWTLLTSAPTHDFRPIS